MITVLKFKCSEPVRRNVTIRRGVSPKTPEMLPEQFQDETVKNDRVTKCKRQRYEAVWAPRLMATALVKSGLASDEEVLYLCVPIDEGNWYGAWRLQKNWESNGNRFSLTCMKMLTKPNQISEILSVTWERFRRESVSAPGDWIQTSETTEL